MLEKKLLEEVNRFRAINKYGSKMIMEQEVPPAPEAAPADLGSKVEQMKPETPQEKLEMRSLDSYPFNEKPQEFFARKKGEMDATGKNEYVLTKDEVENYSQDELKTSFNPIAQEDEFKF